MYAAGGLPSHDQIFERSPCQTERTGEVVGGSDGQNSYGDGAPGEPAGDLAYGAIASGDCDDIARFIERFFPFILFCR